MFFTPDGLRMCRRLVVTLKMGPNVCRLVIRFEHGEAPYVDVRTKLEPI